MKRFQTDWNESAVTPAAYIPLYPLCNLEFVDDADVAGGPIRIFHGEADDYVPIGPCQAYVKRLKQAGKDVEITALPSTYLSAVGQFAPRLCVSELLSIAAFPAYCTFARQVGAALMTSKHGSSVHIGSVGGSIQNAIIAGGDVVSSPVSGGTVADAKALLQEVQAALKELAPRIATELGASLHFSHCNW
jgi:hypothetical protein